MTREFMYYQDNAIVLSRKDFREDDILVTCYTEKHGKLVLQAKGAKKIKSKLAGHLEPLTLTRIDWVSGKGGDKLIGASGLESYQDIKNNYRKVIYGFYFLEVINKAIHTHHPDKKVFDFLKSVLHKLVLMDEKFLPLIKLSFDYKILYLLGHNAVGHQELKNVEQEAIHKIVNLKVDDILSLNFDRQMLNNLYLKSKYFLEEVIESEVLSLKSLEY